LRSIKGPPTRTATALARRGLRTDQITLDTMRAEVGNYLGLALETVSRAPSRLAREGLIRLADGGRRAAVSRNQATGSSLRRSAWPMPRARSDRE
jgi:CRP/FNR family transcriptional regulator, anaerobic regulatory protein